MQVDMGRVSKKMSVALLAVVCATVLAYQGTLDASAWEGFVRWVAVAYLGAQGAVDVTRALRG